MEPRALGSGEKLGELAARGATAGGTSTVQEVGATPPCAGGVVPAPCAGGAVPALTSGPVPALLMPRERQTLTTWKQLLPLQEFKTTSHSWMQVA